MYLSTFIMDMTRFPAVIVPGTTFLDMSVIGRMVHAVLPSFSLFPSLFASVHWFRHSPQRRRRESKFKGFHRYSSFSIHDRRLYRVIELDNGLVDLLVHDPQIYPDGLLEGSHLLDKTKIEGETEDDGEDEDEDDDGNGDEDGDDKEEEDTDDEKHIEEKFVQFKKGARNLGKFKEYIAGRTSEATFDDVFEKKIAIFRYLRGCDPTGENLQLSHKKEAAKQCDCTLLDVENVLAMFTWAKEVHKKMVKLKEEGKPMPKNFPNVGSGVEHEVCTNVSQHRVEEPGHDCGVLALDWWHNESSTARRVALRQKQHCEERSNAVVALRRGWRWDEYDNARGAACEENSDAMRTA
ncbi:S-adenosyl-L-methionine-dependent methyltransferases superfamily protein [Hibiscus syriacus]|uniref:S-adenosyl-L-methionine-dependent methyltransferases superfamily protein n=1 Tax=Hibiscus syriacus TaxID=106335 RepID=A0A6A2XP72_HIBSY|nr:S-adenosyl-L-methionine-dependent methyltransferases superfamily protein [Hibiscus syriacus]